MAQNVTRVNLSAMAFPFLSELSGRGIIVKQSDQNYVATITSKEDTDKDIGIPVLYYCHNVIATGQGYESIDYVTLIGSLPIANFTSVISVIESLTSNKAYIGITSDGTFYYSVDPFYAWTLIGNIPTLAGKTVYAAYINGVTYLYFSGVECRKFNFTAHTLDVVTLTGLTPADIVGITSVQGYLVAWSKSALAWSSLIDPTDFVPSLATGAGGGSVQGAEGDIVACIPHTIGMVVYTNQNAVAAPTSGNARYPFNFRKLVASGGIASNELVTYDANTGNHYTYTTSGLQLITLQQTQTVFPELTDFLAGAVFEDFDEATNTFSTISLTTTMLKRFKLISDRYLIISYGILEFTHVIIYDISLKRWGKLRHTHVDVFEFSLLAAEIVETPRRSIAFADKTGKVMVVKIDARNTTANGVVLFGKYQYIRSRMTSLETVTLENIIPGGTISCSDFYALDGKNTVEKIGYLLEQAGMYVKYAFGVVAMNHSLLIKGAFNLVTITIATHIHGRR